MTQADTLLLRDIHQPPPPPWWPPAPGWWLLFGGLMLVLAAWRWWAWRRRRRLLAIARMFDDAMTRASTPSESIAAMSELLRRAARRIDPGADTLLGDDWLRFLDKGLQTPVFSAGAGAALHDGVFRRDMSPTEVEGLREVARERFLSWMTAP